MDVALGVLAYGQLSDALTSVESLAWPVMTDAAGIPFAMRQFSDLDVDGRLTLGLFFAWDFGTALRR
ncbi:hypothetical protein [Georgenia sp. Marseille-Q6866]